MALSYCWGGTQQLTLRKDNVDELTDGVSIQLLPKTLQDAITVAQEMCVQYIWCDSLCIMQDDEDDVAREIAAMPNIYSHSYFTVKEGRSSSMNDGFLQDRTETEAPNLTCELPFRCPDRTIGSVVLLSQDNLMLWEPLDNRAWALQEHILSTRTVEFGTRLVIWDCPSAAARGMNTDGWRAEKDFNRKTQGLYTRGFSARMVREASLLGKAREIRENSSLHLWYTMREAYTTRQLTVPTDRILAISGIAERYNSLFRDEYLAGLWKFAFPFELLWEPMARRAKHSRPKVYQGPSWSWTSINGIIRWGSVLNLELGKHDRMELLDYKVDLVSEEAPFGAVRSAHITVKARMKPAVYTPPTEETCYFGRLQSSGAEGIDNNLLADVIEDAVEDDDEKTRKQRRAVLLSEVAHPREDNYGSMGLVLQALDNQW
jgi:hypothetical protein